MPKKGGKSKRKKTTSTTQKKDLPLADNENSMYGRVEKLLGSCRMTVLCSDGKERLAHIRGSLQRRCWISVGDIVLLSLRSFQEDKVDIMYRYKPNEVSTLVRDNEISTAFSVKKITSSGESNKDAPVEDGFIFDDDIDIEKI